MKSEKYYIYFINTIKSLKNLQQFHQVIIIMEKNILVINMRNKIEILKLKFADKNLKHLIEFIIKNAGFLAKNKIKMRSNNYC